MSPLAAPPGRPLIIMRFGSGLGGPYGGPVAARGERVRAGRGRGGRVAAAGRRVLRSGHDHEEEVVHLLFARH